MHSKKGFVGGVALVVVLALGAAGLVRERPRNRGVSSLAECLSCRSDGDCEVARFNRCGCDQALPLARVCAADFLAAVKAGQSENCDYKCSPSSPIQSAFCDRGKCTGRRSVSLDL